MDDAALVGDVHCSGQRLDEPGRVAGRLRGAVELPIQTTTQPGAFTGMQFRGRHPLITLSGAFSGATVDGLVIWANNCTVRGLTVVGFRNGIRLFSGGNTVYDSFIGTDPYQPNDAGNRDTGIGVYGVSNTILNNLISGNGWVGLDIPGALNTTVQGNYIGTNGTGAILGWQGNRQGTGVLLRGGDVATTIAGNLISGNAGMGIDISGLEGASYNNIVQGNYIGTNYNGTAVVGNGQAGVRIDNGSRNNTIGGSTAGARNLISGNSSHGIVLQDPGTTNNTVQGNYVGTNYNGTAVVGNGQGRVWIDNGSSNNTIERNVIAGNNWSGVNLLHSGTSGNAVRGNYIGTNAAGTAALGNGAGVWLDGGASGNTVGGSAAGAGNLISGSQGVGLALLSSGTKNNVVQGNYIGTDVSGTVALGNSHGFWLSQSAGNLIGGSAAGAGNLISGSPATGPRASCSRRAPSVTWCRATKSART
jgi:titin